MNPRGGPQIIPRPPDWRLGAAAPWAHLDPADRRFSMATVLERLSNHREPRFHDRGMGKPTKVSAVLVALYDLDDEVHVLLTRRSPTMRSHTHEVSFPGGRKDPEDPNLIATALREAEEEVALDPSAVTIVGELDRFVTAGSGSMINPFVGTLPSAPTNLVANPAEVEAIRHVPLSELLLPEVWREEVWSMPGRGEWPITFFELYGDTVWGATGAMLRQLLCIVTGTDSDPIHLG